MFYVSNLVTTKQKSSDEIYIKEKGGGGRLNKSSWKFTLQIKQPECTQQDGSSNYEWTEFTKQSTKWLEEKKKKNYTV